jgi:hypothetical protein
VIEMLAQRIANSNMGTAGSHFLFISCNQLQLGKSSNTFQQHWNFEFEHLNVDGKYWSIFQSYFKTENQFQNLMG